MATPKIAFFDEEDILDMLSNEDLDEIYKDIQENKRRIDAGEKCMTYEELKQLWKNTK